MATTTIRVAIDALFDALALAGIKRDVRSDPSAPPPGPVMRLTVDAIEPFNPSQGETSPTQWKATLGAVLATATHGGGGASETTIELALMVESLADACMALSAGAGITQYGMGAFRAFVGAGGLTKMGGQIVVTYT